VSEGHDPASGTFAPPSDRHRQTDVLSSVLRTVRLTGALFFNIKASSPWVAESLPSPELAPIILPRAQHVVSYHVITDGQCWAEVAGEAPVQLQAGDVVVVPHGDAYALSSRPGMLGQIARPEIDSWFRQMMLGELPLVLIEGEGTVEDRRVLCGFLGCDVLPFNPVLAALPRLLHIRAWADPGASRLGHLIEFALAEVSEPRAGRDCMLLRISELMFVEVVRHHLAALPPGQSGWLAGLRDAEVGKGLALLHREPARDWTVEDLARQAGLSRSTFAERFTQLVGMPPMQYLARWRMQVAAGLLASDDRKIAAVALEVGYESEAAFSRAFKALVGCSPVSWKKLSAGRDGSRTP
jgi:AraC-like DNA-binding protein